MSKDARAEVFVNMLRDVGVEVDSRTKVLDLGCGAGHLVKAARAKGYDFYGAGVDMRDAHNASDPLLVEQRILRPIPFDPYRLPFDDATFDVVISDMVLEHVMDYPTTLREIHRVLKPGGAFLHLFASRYSPLEPHVHVPLATMVKSRWWLRTWAQLGVRNEFQKRMTAAEAAAANRKFLTSRTNYLPRRELKRLFAKHYTDVRFIEDSFLKNSVRGRKVYPLAKRLPILTRVYSAVANRVLFGRKPVESGYSKAA